VVLVLPRPPGSRRMGVISPIERNRWMVTTGGWFGEYPEPDPRAFLEFLQHLPSRYIYDVIRDARPVSPVTSYRMKGGLRRYYERMERWPEGLLVMGDALCSFNPLYSQGMSVCAMQAEALQEALPRGGAGRHIMSGTHQVQVAIARSVEGSWAMARTEDLRFPQTTGCRSIALKMQHWFGSALITAARNDRRVRTALLRAINLLDEGPGVYHPYIVLRVAVAVARAALSRGNPGETGNVGTAEHEISRMRGV
jgi:2-polyprenyl-6-methoxyphenol hydroxylase-like FAD-dependent oxidoreductase